MKKLDPVTLADIEAAVSRISRFALRTPLVRLNHAGPAIFLKLENLQPIGSFKLRGAGNAIACEANKNLSDGILTASAGNMGQGVAWIAKELAIPCTVIVPDHAPETKLAALRSLGATIISVTFDEWWEIIVTHNTKNLKGHFIHPVSDSRVIAGNGTIGLEILEDLPDVDTVLIPYGGGGLSSGIATAIRALKPDVKIFACEVETAAPFAASLAAGKPVVVEYQPSFVDGIGGKSVLPEMWDMAKSLLNGSLVVSLAEVAQAIRLLAVKNHVIAEGAGATPVAAALHKLQITGKTVCVVSGGNIDSHKLADIFSGADVPSAK